MKVLHVLGSDSMGGCERWSIDLAAYYADRGVEQSVLFFADAGSGPAWREFASLGVTCHVIPYCGRRIAFIRAIASLCRRDQISVVLTHGFGMHLLIALGARYGGAAKILALIGNPPPSDFFVLCWTTLRAHFARPFVTREIACSEYVKKRMMQKYRLPSRRIAVVHYGVRVDEIAERSTAVRQRAIASSEVHGPIIIMVARLDPIKDHATVIRALVALRYEFPTTILRLVGDGPMRAKLELLANDLGLSKHIEFLGARDDIPEQLGSADIFVYGTTVDEGFGIVLAEAMAAGLPIVCTDIGPCAEVLDGGKAGTLVPPRNPDALAKAVAALLNDPLYASQLGRRAQAFSCEHYSVAKAARAIERITGSIGKLVN